MRPFLQILSAGLEQTLQRGVLHSPAVSGQQTPGGCQLGVRATLPGGLYKT